MVIFLASMSALLYGLADFTGGFASGKSHVLPVVLTSQIAGFATALVFLLFSGVPAPPFPDLAWGALAGFFGTFGIVVLYRGLAAGLVAVVSPISAIVGALVPLLFGFALGERLSLPSVIGVCLCLPAVLLLSCPDGKPEKIDSQDKPRARLNFSLLSGLVAGLGFGGFFIAISRSAQGSGLWPLIGARCMSLSLVLTGIGLSKTRPRLGRAALLPAMLAGIEDMGANILFLTASRLGMLSLASMITALYPAPTVILGRIVFGQRLSPLRILGLCLALAGVALISLG